MSQWRDHPFVLQVQYLWPWGGDVKLFFVTGLYMRSAWEVLFFLILSCVLGIAGSVISRREKIPFGPAIAAACFCMLLYGDIWTQWYTGLF